MSDLLNDKGSISTSEQYPANGASQPHHILCFRCDMGQPSSSRAYVARSNKCHSSVTSRRHRNKFMFHVLPSSFSFLILIPVLLLKTCRFYSHGFSPDTTILLFPPCPMVHFQMSSSPSLTTFYSSTYCS